MHHRHAGAGGRGGDRRFRLGLLAVHDVAGPQGGRRRQRRGVRHEVLGCHLPAWRHAGLLQEHSAAGKTTAAVCASPAVVLAAHGILPQKATCYPAPAFKEQVPGWQSASAVVDGHTITSQGPGTSLQFALKIVEQLFDKAKAEELAAQMLTTTA